MGIGELFARAAVRNIPLEVSLELTHHCNFRCRHCYIPDFGLPDGLTTERIFGLLDELADMGTLYLTLTGGEMMLRRDWPAVARRARELGFLLTLLTNGSLIGEAEADLIAELPAKTEISFYSADEATFDAITARPGSFRRVRRAIDLLLERGVEVKLKMPVMTLNQRDIQGVAELAARLGVDWQAFPDIISKKDGNPGPLQLRVPPEALPTIYSGPITSCDIDPAHDTLERDPEAPLCAAGRRYANITAAGDVQACNILPGSAGNINEHSFREIWEGSPWLRRIRGIRFGDLPVCSTCPVAPYCSRCMAQALVEDGDLLGPSSWACAQADVRARMAKKGA